ncbi:flagellin [Rhizobium sp. CG4]|jgi:flagellin|uniref:flagellin N-terminal helical domain-containing protein n=1 Tax=Rhizobium/Agrobacterium group TaxID=227290 RepID=UPI00178407CE|nr:MULTISPECIES: flagellin [Rhizobium/Agrobacterium group]MBD9386018.1 flagellin [Agrobacterium sp. AGB01]MCM2456230.1 flagellin [Rhizobium sp. CG4]MCS4243473.1 flagellin [Rhizobium sp. BIGb0125]MDO5894523.1 flagellin [Agrobacterium sp. Azo12]
MTSILTNIAAMSALETLRNINSNMETTQGRVSSGLRVGEASDNAAYWSIATTMRSDNMALDAVSDALGLGAAKVDTAYTAMESAIDVVKEIKKKLVTAQENSVDSKKVQEEIDQLQDQLKSISEAASFSGENWVIGSGTQSVVSGFVRDSNNNVTVKHTEYVLNNAGTDANVLFGVNTAGSLVTTAGILGQVTTVGSVGFSVIELDVTNTATDYLKNALDIVETALKQMTSAAADLGSISMRIDLQEEFVAKLNESIESGIGRLVDADMNEESTRLKALQTQQQLGIQSLSIANSNSENILSLFR